MDSPRARVWQVFAGVCLSLLAAALGGYIAVLNGCVGAGGGASENWICEPGLRRAAVSVVEVALWTVCAAAPLAGAIASVRTGNRLWFLLGVGTTLGAVALLWLLGTGQTLNT